VRAAACSGWLKVVLSRVAASVSSNALTVGMRSEAEKSPVVGDLAKLGVHAVRSAPRSPVWGTALWNAPKSSKPQSVDRPVV
jgi:hypothetical protein